MTQLNLLHNVQPRRIVSPLVPELKRRENNETRVLRRLQHGPATNMELMDIGGLRFSGRVSDLRAKGYIVTQEHIHGGLHVYTLKGRR